MTAARYASAGADRGATTNCGLGPGTGTRSVLRTQRRPRIPYPPRPLLTVVMKFWRGLRVGPVLHLTCHCRQFALPLPRARPSGLPVASISRGTRRGRRAPDPHRMVARAWTIDGETVESAIVRDGSGVTEKLDGTADAGLGGVGGASVPAHSWVSGPRVPRHHSRRVAVAASCRKAGGSSWPSRLLPCRPAFREPETGPCSGRGQS